MVPDRGMARLFHGELKWGWEMTNRHGIIIIIEVREGNFDPSNGVQV